MRMVWSATLAAGIGPNAVRSRFRRTAGEGDRQAKDATSPYGHGGFNPILDPRCRIIPLSEATLMATQRRFVRQRFASHITRPLAGFGPVSVTL